MILRDLLMPFMTKYIEHTIQVGMHVETTHICSLHTMMVSLLLFIYQSRQPLMVRDRILLVRGCNYGQPYTYVQYLSNVGIVHIRTLYLIFIQVNNEFGPSKKGLVHYGSNCFVDSSKSELIGGSQRGPHPLKTHQSLGSFVLVAKSDERLYAQCGPFLCVSDYQRPT